jgi:hypothetical protein
MTVTPTNTPPRVPKKQKTEQTPPKIQPTNSASAFGTPDTKPQAQAQSFSTPTDQGITTPTDIPNPPVVRGKENSEIVTVQRIHERTDEHLAVPDLNNDRPGRRIAPRPRNNNR